MKSKAEKNIERTLCGKKCLTRLIGSEEKIIGQKLLVVTLIKLLMKI